MATVTHLLDKPLPYGQHSVARWAVAPAGKAVVFVHGFGGHATRTWGDFKLLLPQIPDAAGYDLIFYGYDSTHTRLRTSAVLLRGLLDDLLNHAAAVANPHLPPSGQRGAEFAYSDVLLVTHSLGAAVARQALIEDWYDGAGWAGRVRLAAFAPAHRGADLFTLARGMYGPLSLLNLVATALKQGLLVLQDLEPGCDTLIHLEADCREALASGTGAHLTARLVVLGEKDAVVNPNRFAADPGAAVIGGTDHSSVCKPGPAFRAPLDQVAALL